MDIKGLRWYKTDLHLHTATSECFADQQVTPEQWVEKCLEKGLECVAVTDHNTGRGIDAIKRAAEGKLIVFPGVEVTCSDSKIHVLVLFDPTKDGEHINSFLSKIDIIPQNFGKQEAHAKGDLLEIARIAAEREGIVIPAHIDQFNGLGNIGSQVVKDGILTHPNILGLQVVHDFLFDNKSYNDVELQTKFNEVYGEGKVDKTEWVKWKDAANFYKNSSLPKLTFSDNPNSTESTKHGLWGIGERFTWIKMDKDVSIESLRQALLMPDNRIRNDFETKECPKNNSEFFIEKIEIAKTIYNQQNLTDTIYFSPEMTTIVGGRGTGKSSIIKMLRGILNLTNELQEYPELLQEHNDFFQVNHNGNGVFTQDSVVNITCYKERVKYDIRLSFNDNTPAFTSHITYEDGNVTEYGHEDTLGVLKSLKANIFSQKQVYEIAKNPNSLRDFIDSQCKVIQSLKTTLDENLLKYRNHHLKIMELKEKLKEKPFLEIKREDLRSQFGAINGTEIEKQMDIFSAFKNEETAFNKILESLHEKITLIEQAIQRPVLSFVLDDYRNEYREEISIFAKMFEAEITTNNSALQVELERLNNLYKQISSKKEDTRWNEDRIIFFERFKELEDTQGNLSELIFKKQSLYSEIEEVESTLKGLVELSEEVNKLKGEKEGILTSILETRNEIYSARQEFVRNKIGDNPNLKVDIKLFRDKKYFEVMLRELISRATGFETEVTKVIDTCFNGNVSRQLKPLKEEIYKIIKNEESSLQVNGHFKRLLQNIDETDLWKLDTLLPEDEVAISYRLGSNGDYKPLNNASAGQKTSAILTLILSSGNQPLILDQPEDDLDNSLIYSLIVERMLKSKKNRQIIVVTHNANIPVNGDSELINIMSSSEISYSPLVTGSIENNHVKESICNIMEGGMPAFQSRALKYNLDN